MIDLEQLSPALARYLVESHTTHCLVASLDGTVRGVNAAMSASLGVGVAQLVEQPIWGLLTEPDAASLRQRLSASTGGTGKLLLNFVDTRHFPFTLECCLDVGPDRFVLLGEPPREKASAEEWLQLNNQLAVLNRENVRKTRELEQARAQLEKALADLNDSYWHLKKIQEVLPICMSCGKVKAGTHWEDLVRYLSEHALFLSHGYCPPCTLKVMAEWGIAPDAGGP